MKNYFSHIRQYAPATFWGICTAIPIYLKLTDIFILPALWKAIIISILTITFYGLANSLIPRITSRLNRCRFSSSAQFFWGLGSCLAGIILVLAIPLQIPTLVNSSWLSIVYIITAGCSIGFGLYLVSVYLGTKDYGYHTAKTPPQKRVILYYAFPLILVWVIGLLGFWPGLMSPDSIDQWQQAHNFQINDWHPAFSTLTIWAITRLWDSPAAIAVVQILTFGLLAGWGLYRMEAEGVPKGIIWSIVILLIALPVNGPLIITLWKDIPFTLSIFCLTLLFWHIAMTNGEWLIRKWAWLILGIIAALIGLYRHNGLPVAIGSLLWLLLYYPKSWKKVALSVVCCLGILVIIQGLIYKTIRVTPSNLTAGVILTHRIAAHLYFDTTLTPDESGFLNQVRPIDDNWSYDCYSINPTYFNEKYNKSFVASHTSRIVEIYWQLTLQNPSVEWKHSFCANSLIWRIKQHEDAYLYTLPITENSGHFTYIHKNIIGLEENSLFPVVMQIFYRYVSRSLNTIFWRPAFYLYLLIFCGVIQSIRLRSWRISLYMVPVILSSSVLMIIILAQDFRYLYPNFPVAILFIGGLFLPLRSMPTANESYTSATAY